MSHTKVRSHSPIEDLCTSGDGEFIWTSKEGNAYRGSKAETIDIGGKGDSDNESEF